MISRDLIDSGVTLTAEPDIQNATVYDSDDIRAIFKAIYAHWDALPPTWMGTRINYVNGERIDTPHEYQRITHELPDCPIRVRGYSPTDKATVGDFFRDHTGDCIILKIQPPKKLPRNALLALAQCADGDDAPSLDRRHLVKLVKLICENSGMRNPEVDASKVITDYKLRLRYHPKADAREVKRQKRKDLLLRHTKLLRRDAWKANEIYAAEKKLEQRRAERADIKRKIKDIERKLGEL